MVATQERKNRGKICCDEEIRSLITLCCDENMQTALDKSKGLKDKRKI
jgi:hypothetical protein